MSETALRQLRAGRPSSRSGQAPPICSGSAGRSSKCRSWRRDDWPLPGSRPERPASRAIRWDL